MRGASGPAIVYTAAAGTPGGVMFALCRDLLTMSRLCRVVFERWVTPVEAAWSVVEPQSHSRCRANHDAMREGVKTTTRSRSNPGAVTRLKDG